MVICIDFNWLQSLFAGSTFLTTRFSLILSLILFIQFNGHAGAKVFLNIFQVSVVSRHKSSCQHRIEYFKLKLNNYHLRNPRILDVLCYRGWPKLKHSILFYNRSTKISKDVVVESSSEIKWLWIGLTDVDEGRVSGKSFKGKFFFLLPRYRFKFLYWIDLSLHLWDGLLITTTRILEILHLFYCCYSDELTTEPCKRISRVQLVQSAYIDHAYGGFGLCYVHITTSCAS